VIIDEITPRLNSKPYNCINYLWVGVNRLTDMNVRAMALFIAIG